jgi:hypothetical protein
MLHDRKDCQIYIGVRAIVMILVIVASVWFTPCLTRAQSRYMSPVGERAAAAGTAKGSCSRWLDPP